MEADAFNPSYSGQELTEKENVKKWKRNVASVCRRGEKNLSRCLEKVPEGYFRLRIRFEADSLSSMWMLKTKRVVDFFLKNEEET